MKYETELYRTTTTESLLGLLSMYPMSGYEIKKLIQKSIGNFWRESFGQIYPALKQMEQAGLVAQAEPGENSGRAERKVYRLTGAGEERLRKWLESPARPQVPRNDLLLKVFFGDRAERGVVRAQVESTLAHYRAELVRLDGIRAAMEATFAEHAAMPYWRMTVRYGLAEARALAKWCEETLAELETMESRDQNASEAASSSHTDVLRLVPAGQVEATLEHEVRA